jgi:hypothetical protein
MTDGRESGRRGVQAPHGNTSPPAGIVMSGWRPLIKVILLWCDDRGCGHVFGLLIAARRRLIGLSRGKA